MTTAEIVANVIAFLSFVLAAIALRRTSIAEARERQAIVSIRIVWSGHQQIDAGAITGTAAPQPAPPSADSDLQFVIDGMPTIYDGLELRSERYGDYANDRSGNFTYQAILEVTNYGRWVATQVRLDCTIYATYLEEHGPGTEDRVFPGQAITFDALAPDKARYIKIGNLPGIPTQIKFTSITAADGQPTKLVPPDEIAFQPRGYQ